MLKIKLYFIIFQVFFNYFSYFSKIFAVQRRNLLHLKKKKLYFASLLISFLCDLMVLEKQNKKNLQFTTRFVLKIVEFATLQGFFYKVNIFLAHKKPKFTGTAFEVNIYTLITLSVSLLKVHCTLKVPKTIKNIS